MSHRPVVGIAAGDPAGVGPEIFRSIVSSFDHNRAEIRIIGSLDSMAPGNPSPASARAAWDALELAADLALRGEVDALVTGPVCKHSLREIGFPYPGQTEFFADRAGVKDFAMVLTGGAITVGLATIHEPLGSVANLLSTDLIVRRGALLHRFVRARGCARPRIAVAGLNPHAGECGEIGTEELTIIRPAVTGLDEKFPGVFSGPFAPDTIFHRCLEGEFDAVLCMYHDQGLIPLKLHAFHQGVNVTVGLPFYRTSPDHGTAFEIAGRGIARVDSTLAALELAVELASARIE